MRILKFVVINFILVFALTICMGISKVEAQTFLGKFCWLSPKVGIPEDPPSPEVFSLSVLEVGNTHFGDNRFIVTGKYSPSFGTEDKALHGGAEIVGSNIIMTLNSSKDNVNETEISTYHISLDVATLNGTYNEIWSKYTKSSGLMSTGHRSDFLSSNCRIID